MRLILFVLLMIFGNLAFSQIEFEKGYFINNEGEKTECWIKNVNWMVNPEAFEYKLSETSEPLKATVAEIREFGVDQYSKYTRAEVQIDFSSDNISNLSRVKEPIFIKDTVWFQFLLEGKASLYIYRTKNLERFFYNVDNSPINQLIYKEYLGENNKIGTNKGFHAQLWQEIKCPAAKTASITSLDYRKDDLKGYFSLYNECHNAAFVDWEKKKHYDALNFKVKSGINYSSLTINNEQSKRRNTDFSNNISLRFGLELEFILPFNKNKWSVIVDPSYNYYKSESENMFSTRPQYVKVAYKSLELPLGLKYSIFFNPKTKIFLNALLVYDVVITSNIDYEWTADLSGSSNLDAAFGIGFNFSRFSFETRYQLTRDILSNYLSYSGAFNKSALIIGYSIF